MGLSIAEQLKEEGRAEGRAEGLSIAEQLKAEGKAEGEAGEARRFLLRQLREQFGDLPAPALAWVEEADLEQCEAMGLRLLHARSLSELGFSGTEGDETRPVP